MFLACTCFRFWFQMYLVYANRKFEWVWWIWFEIHLDLLFVLHCCCDSFFSGKQFFFLTNWASKIFFLVRPRIGSNPLTGPGGGGSGPREKNLLSNRAGSGPRVGFGYGKTWLEPDPFPFLDMAKQYRFQTNSNNHANYELLSQ